MTHKLQREANVALTLAMRDLTLIIKSPAKLIPAVVFPVMLLGMFGGQLSQNMGRNMGYDFNAFMLVGMLVQGLFMMMTNGVASLVEDRQTNFNQELLVSPAARTSLILGKIAGALFTSYIQFFTTLAIGLFIGARLSAAQLLTLLAFSPLVCLAAGALAVLTIGFIRKSSTASIVTMTLTMTQTFLSGALIPVNHSTGVMAVVSRLLPMTYCVDLMRGVFYQHGTGSGAATLHSPTVNLIIIAAFTVAFLAAGTAAFVRAETNR
ncbi:MAG: ABC transporter permease [Spirochaetaceae bacterium]|jgi:ABC-2 type transport system permease protein|nr:ABC transporter permease [Spirochaetaceae bacterium]